MNECKCNKCGYSWTKRIDRRPKACPECKARDWDKEKGRVKLGNVDCEGK